MKRRLLKYVYAVCSVSLALFVALVIMPKLVPEDDADTVPAAAPVAAEADPLDEFSLQHEQLRALQISQLDEIINSEQSSRETIDAAQKEKIEILRRMEIEQTVAGILRARGYKDAAVAVSEDYVTVMIRAIEVGDQDAARILELVLSQTDLDAEEIKIIPIN